MMCRDRAIRICHREYHTRDGMDMSNVTLGSLRMILEGMYDSHSDATEMDQRHAVRQLSSIAGEISRRRNSSPKADTDKQLSGVRWICRLPANGYGKVCPQCEQDGHKSLICSCDHTLIISPYLVSPILCSVIEHRLEILRRRHVYHNDCHHVRAAAASTDRPNGPQHLPAHREVPNH
jgi:hypothetical protein